MSKASFGRFFGGVCKGDCGSRWVDRFGGTGTVACSRHVVEVFVGVLALGV